MQLQINEESLPVYEALASKTRIKIIQLLSKKKMNVKDLAKELGVSSAITTMHVKKLEEANIIKTEKVGQQKISSLRVDKIDISFPEKIFNAFEQETSDVAQKYGGTGLGLSISRRFASLMGGSLILNSEVGKGSVFTADIPFQISEKKKAPAVDYGKLRVLVADDDMVTCEHVSLLLNNMGIRSAWTDNGYDAVSRVEQAHNKGEDFDVCFVDWKMPGLDGLETTRRIQNIVGNECTSVVLITAYDPGEIEEAAKEAGAVGVISKPLFETTLSQAFESIRMTDPANPPQSKREARHDFTGRHILIAEDNEINREIAVELVAMSGAEVTAVENGEEALNIFNASDPGFFDLILMDIQMPVLDGYEAARKIRSLERPDAGTVPIFAMTANAFAEDMEKSRQSGMDDHINKPIDLNELFDKMASRLS